MLNTRKSLNEKESPSQSDLELAQIALKNIKAKVTSSNDIISREQFPRIYPDEMDQYVKKFGEPAVRTFLDNMHQLEGVRNASLEAQSKFSSSLKHPVTARSIAITYFGVGECQETTSRAVMELGLLGCKTNFTVVRLDGKLDDMGIPDMHALLIIGDTSCLKPNSDIITFKKLGNDCLLVDPFLGVIGKANKIGSLIGKYIRAYQLFTIAELTDIDPLKTDFNQLKDEAEFLAVEIKKNLSREVNAPNSLLASTAFISVTDPLSKCIVMLSNACKQSDKKEELLDAINKDLFALAFRKACAYGEEQVVNLLVENRSLLGDFSLNESSSNGFTAVDWVKKAAYEKTKQERILERIIAAGAVSAEQIKEKICDTSITRNL
jgi:hypothetical protein